MPRFSTYQNLSEDLRKSLMTLHFVIGSEAVTINLWDEMLGVVRQDAEELTDSELTHAMDQAPSKYVFYETQCERMKFELEILETEFDMWLAGESRAARDRLRDLGMKTPTQGAILEEVLSVPARKAQYGSMRGQLALLRKNTAILHSAAKAMDRRMDMLQSIGAMRRSERMSL
jgi:hypothetical protein